jgi:poly(A) polymerase
MFEEDPLRILRMYRFAHRLRFVIKDDLRQAARKFAHHLVYISTERIHDEFMKIVGGNSADIAISEMVADGVAPFVLKGLVDMTDKDFKNAMEMVHCLSFWGQSKLVRLAAIFTMGYNDVKKDMNDLKFSNDDIKAVDTMVTAAVWAKELCRNKNAWDEAAVRLFIHTCKGFHHQTLCIMEASIRNSEKRFLDFPGYGPLTTEYAFMSQETIDFLINPKTALDGNEVKEILGIKDGPALGRVMKELKEMAISGHITTREEAEQWLTTK